MLASTICNPLSWLRRDPVPPISLSARILGHFRAKQRAQQRHSPTHQQSCCRRTPQAIDTSGLRPVHQKVQDSGSHINMLAPTQKYRALHPEALGPGSNDQWLVLGTRADLIHQCVGTTPGPNLTYHWVGISPMTP